MRPIIAALALSLTLSACTIREETFAPRGEALSDRFSFVRSEDVNSPPDVNGASCPGGFAQGSDMQLYRDGTQDLFCH